MPEPTAEQLDALLALQVTDTAVRRLQHQLDQLEEQRQLDTAEAELAGLAGEHDRVRVELERARAEQRQLEREIDVLTQRRDAEQARLYGGTVTNQREMRSVEAEIEITVRRISEHEDLLLESLERVEQLEGEQEHLTTTIGETTERVGELTLARDTAAASILAERGEREVVRERQVAELPGELVARYEQVADRTGGMAVGVLEGQSCSACRVELSMADIGDLLAGPPLTTCPQCRRLMVVPA